MVFGQGCFKTQWFSRPGKIEVEKCLWALNNGVFGTLCQSHFCGVLEAERRWKLVENCMGGEEGEGGKERVTFITLKQLG